MFKMIAALAVVAGGAGYGVYTYTDLLGGDSGGCPLARKACCQKETAATTEPDCCLKHEECCEVAAPCCSAERNLTAKAKPGAIAAATLPCCAVPCAACADGCDGCPICAIDCGECCGLSAKVAVAGPAAVFAAKK